MSRTTHTRIGVSSSRSTRVDFWETPFASRALPACATEESSVGQGQRGMSWHFIVQMLRQQVHHEFISQLTEGFKDFSPLLVVDLRPELKHEKVAACLYPRHPSEIRFLERIESHVRHCFRRQQRQDCEPYSCRCCFSARDNHLQRRRAFRCFRQGAPRLPRNRGQIRWVHRHLCPPCAGHCGRNHHG